MGSWNYRMVHYHDGSGYAVHEVYYDDNGLPTGMTVRPQTPVCDSPQEVVKILELMLADATKRAIFREPPEWTT